MAEASSCHILLVSNSQTETHAQFDEDGLRDDEEEGEGEIDSDKQGGADHHPNDNAPH